jgi:hypothetical protein
LLWIGTGFIFHSHELRIPGICWTIGEHLHLEIAGLLIGINNKDILGGGLKNGIPVLIRFLIKIIEDNRFTAKVLKVIGVGDVIIAPVILLP